MASYRGGSLHIDRLHSPFPLPFPSAILIPPLCSQLCRFQNLTGPWTCPGSDGRPAYESGSSCLILIATFSQPVIRRLSLGPSSPALRGAGGSCGSEQETFPSITFSVCLSGTFNLFYSTTPLDSTDLPDLLESNEMATLMSVSVSTRKAQPPSGALLTGDLVVKKKKKERKRKERGLISSEPCFKFQRQLLSCPAVPVRCTVYFTDGHVWSVCHGRASSWNLNTRKGAEMRQDESHMIPPRIASKCLGYEQNCQEPGHVSIWRLPCCGQNKKIHHGIWLRSRKDSSLCQWNNDRQTLSSSDPAGNKCNVQTAGTRWNSKHRSKSCSHIAIKYIWSFFSLISHLHRLKSYWSTTLVTRRSYSPSWQEKYWWRRQRETLVSNSVFLDMQF